LSAKVLSSDTTIWAIDRAARLAASRSYAADDELARLRRDAPQTQIGEGANDALLFALARDVLANWEPDRVPEEWRSPLTGAPIL
jgi:alkylation response protein AidB-like acyl-CoA dehydrogenase